jgi:hypothetical protein
MRLDPETRQRSLLPFLAGVLGLMYLFVFLPLDRKARSLEAPLTQSWRQLANALGQTNALELDFVTLTNQFEASRTALNLLEAARNEASTRVELDADLRAQLGRNFLLVDYKNEAGRRMDALARLAKQENVVLEPAVFAGFPEQFSDMKEPALLWAELAFLDSLLTTAIHAQVTTIHSVAAQTPLTNSQTGSNGSGLTGLPLQIELTGPTHNLARFLQTLPLRGDEIKAAGLPAAPTNKPALFIDRLVLRKQSPQKTDEVRLSLRVMGFVFQK